MSNDPPQNSWNWNGINQRLHSAMSPMGGGPGTRKITLKWIWFGAGLLFAGLVMKGAWFDAMPPQARAMASIAVLMAIWWITEAIPIAITSLVPLVALPVLGIVNPRAAAAPYADPNVFLFLGGFILAACMQRWNLHKRIALEIVYFIGGSQRRIIIGCMGATAFLSMWASNTATVMMMMPIALALVEGRPEESTEDKGRFATALFICIAYAGSMGGVGTLIGTPPNIVFSAMVRRLDTGIVEVSFLQWMAIGIPMMAIMLPIIYVMVVEVVFRLERKTAPTDRKALADELKALGPISPGEWYIGTAFTLTALLWIFRKDINLGEIIVPGWSVLFAHGKWIHDGTVAIFMAMLLFILPVNWKKGLFLMDRTWFKDIPWNIVLLFGGGFSLAQGFQKSGLSQYLGENMSFLGTLPPFLVMLAIALFMTFLTELTSNTATTTALLPILAASAQAAGYSPLLYMLPATLAASCAFMLPVGTPPNAIVFASGKVSISQMARTGLMINLISAPVIALLSWWLAPRVLGF